MKTFETMPDAVRVANEILEGTMDPHLGCGLIGAIGEKLGYVPALAEFIHLAHLQDGHDPLGHTRESCRPDIMAACRGLVAAQAGMVL